MLPNAAGSMSILWVTWEKRGVASVGGVLPRLRLKVCERARMRRADNWTAARSPGHSAAAEKLLVANALASVPQKKGKKQMRGAVQTDVQSHFQILFVCPHMRWGCVCFNGCAQHDCVCLWASKPVCTLRSCLCMSGFRSEQMVFSECVRTC